MRALIVTSLVLLSIGVLADDGSTTASAKTGKAIYAQTCIACHGANGKGAIPGVADLTKPDGALAKTDAELFKSIAEGLQSPGTALAMPAKGGNPTLSDADIEALLVFLRAEYGS